MTGGTNWRKEIKRGNITLCLLYLLEEESKYGYQLITELRERSGEYFDLKEGTVYPALYRLEKEGFIRSRWIQEDGRQPRNYYRITSSGRRRLQEAMEEWIAMVVAIRRVLERTEQ
jgi:PadR family transcriptional regulator PadR